MKIGVNLKNFKEFEKALAEELPKATSRNVLNRVAKRVMERIRVRMGQLAPYDSADKNRDGEHLKDVMKTQPIKATRQKGSIKFDRSSGVGVLTGPAPGTRLAQSNAGWQEFGTVNMPANSYARPAVDAESGKVIDEVRELLAEEINKAKTRIARKASKG